MHTRTKSKPIRKGSKVNKQESVDSRRKAIHIKYLNTDGGYPSLGHMMAFEVFQSNEESSRKS